MTQSSRSAGALSITTDSHETLAKKATMMEKNTMVSGLTAKEMVKDYNSGRMGASMRDSGRTICSAALGG